MTERSSLGVEPFEPTAEGACDMRWWEHPLIPIAWGIAASVVYALFPSSDMNALLALFAWEVGVLVWMAVCDRGR